MKLQVDDMRAVAKRRYFRTHRKELLIVVSSLITGTLLVVGGLGGVDTVEKVTTVASWAIVLMVFGGVALIAAFIWAIWDEMRRGDYIRGQVQKWVDEEKKGK